MEDMRELRVFIAASLDGFIARPDGDLSWLTVVERPDEDYGYAAFMAEVDTVLLGRKTYEKILSFGGEFPYGDRTCYVFSKQPVPPPGRVNYFAGDPSKLVAELRQQPGQHLFCDGGALTIQALQQADLIDRYTISLIPILLGDGIRLFQGQCPEQGLRLVEQRSFPSGLLQVTYQRDRSGH